MRLTNIVGILACASAAHAAPFTMCRSAHWYIEAVHRPGDSLSIVMLEDDGAAWRGSGALRDSALYIQDAQQGHVQPGHAVWDIAWGPVEPAAPVSYRRWSDSLNIGGLRAQCQEVEAMPSLFPPAALAVRHVRPALAVAARAYRVDGRRVRQGVR